MVNWRLDDQIPDSQWDAIISHLPGTNIFQSSAWARHKLTTGWTVLRARKSDAAAQFLLKRTYFGARVLWARGGPLGIPSLWDAGLRRVLFDGGGLIYGRFCSYQELTPDTARALDQAGWGIPVKPLNRNLTYTLDLTRDVDILRSSFSSNWAHNLRRGEKRGAVVTLWQNPDANEMAALYREMESYKGLPPQHDAASLTSLIQALGQKLIIMRADIDGTLTAFRACALFAEQATDLLAATGEAARRSYASYPLAASLLLAAKAAGAKRYDFGGADPLEAKGVSDFKKGTGAALMETIGERDFASPDAVRTAAGAAIAWKMAANL